ncbi:hypothetical protein F5X99DRAFT_380018 [Biscogniauxia marginata]|nr:hypothetical protein F5X99DRAFT_380018 [Biscogniauxia marginata]
MCQERFRYPKSLMTFTCECLFLFSIHTPLTLFFLLLLLSFLFCFITNRSLERIGQPHGNTGGKKKKRQETRTKKHARHFFFHHSMDLAHKSLSFSSSEIHAQIIRGGFFFLIFFLLHSRNWKSL